MSAAKNCTTVYFYGYVQQNKQNNNCQQILNLPKILKKLPKLELQLPQISINENLGLSFC